MNETYKSLSIVGNADKYTIDCGDDFNDVTRLELGSYEGPMMTLQNVDDNTNTLNFTEGFQLGLNRMQWSDAFDPRLHAVFVPNHLNAATVTEDGDFYTLTTTLPLSLSAYLAWKATSLVAPAGPTLSLLLVDSGDANRPQLFLNEDNIAEIDNTHFRIAKSVATLGGKVLFHHIPWHICELLDFINFAVGSPDIEQRVFAAVGWTSHLTVDVDEGVSKFTSTGAFDFDPFWEDPPAAYTDGVTFGMIDFVYLPFKFVGDESRITPPRMQAIVPPGTYSAGEIGTLLPHYMNVGNLATATSFVAIEGLRAVTVPIAAGYHATPFALLTAVRAGLAATTSNVQCQYANDADSFRTSGRFQFVADEPFLLDFRAASRELQTALNVTDRQYGPETVIKADADSAFPQLWDDGNSHHIYELGMGSANSFTLTAFNPPLMTTVATATQQDHTLVIRDIKEAFPYQVNDVCFFQNGANDSTTGRILGLGQVYDLVVTADFRPYPFFITLAGAIIPGPITVLCRFGDYNLSTNDPNIVTVARKDVALVAEVRLGFSVDNTDAFTIGYLDPPRFEVEPELKSLAPRLGVGSRRREGGFFYTFNAFDFDPIPYLLLFVDDPQGASGNPEHKNFFHVMTTEGTVERTKYPLAKLVTSTPYTITRNQIMDHKFGAHAVRTLNIEFQKPDGSRVDFQGRTHGLTIGFYCLERSFNVNR